MTYSMTMRRIKWLSFGLASAMIVAWALSSLRDGFGLAHDVRVGSGRAYAILGDLPVEHQGRVKPLSSMAVEEIERIHGRSPIRLIGPGGNPTANWEPVAALLDWSARPEFWDDQDFILVDDPPLRRLLLEGARQAAETTATGKNLDALAARTGGDHERLSPRVLEKAQIQHEGRVVTFPRWAGELLGKRDRARFEGAKAVAELTPIEETAIEVAERFFHYQAIRDHKSPAIKPLDLQVVPRPAHENYSKYSTECFKKGMKPDQTLSPLEANVADALVEFLQSLPRKEWALPGEDGVFDQKFMIWLIGSSPWLPLGLVIESDESELSRAGVPIEQVAAFRKSYRDLEAAARAEPGGVSEAVATAVVAAARDLGTSVGRYGDPALMASESRLNRLAPFSKAPMAYGIALTLLLASLAIKAGPRPAAGKLGATLYWLGMFGLAAGIALELYGFSLRFRVARWGPVTNMYETVIWAALATSALGLAFELLWRNTYSALAASGVALLATLLAEHASCLDPSFRAIPTVLRTNRWLFGHVLTIVSSYAAFALAMGLGLLAAGRCLTATYRRSPAYRELAWPLALGIPLYALGCLGLDPPYQFLPLQGLDARALDCAGLGLAAVGGVLTIVGAFSLLGEFANRSPRRSCALGVVLAAVVLGALIAGATGTFRGPWANALVSSNVWLVGVLGGGALAVMSLPAVPAREPLAQVETLADLIYRAMQVGVLLLAAGAMVGAVWGRKAWGEFWSWDPKEVWALITFMVYLAPLLGRWTGWMSPFGLVTASVLCFMAVLASWYGVNFAQRVGLHDYGFTEGGDWRVVSACALAPLGLVGAAAWRRSRSQERRTGFGPSQSTVVEGEATRSSQ
jgi:Cytochrome C assembly protein